MKKRFVFLALVVFIFGFSLVGYAQNSSSADPQQTSSKDTEQPKRHVAFGAFVDYYRFARPASPVNFIGAGARLGFYVNHMTSIEAEMAYDFDQTYSTRNGVIISTNRRRPLHGLFGPKFDFGSRNFDVFVTGKVGFVNFTSSTKTPSSSFVGAVTSVDNGDTLFALYPGGGIEGYWGFFGIRADVGDEIYFSGGAQHNLRISFGPQFRF
jgi:hypothetical protein